MDKRIQKIENRYKKDKLPKFAPGDTIQVHQRLKEGDRVQVFEGAVVGRRGGGLREMVIVRKQSYGVGVEKIFPIHSPVIIDIKLVRKGDVRRAKLYYLREKTARSTRIALGQIVVSEEDIAKQEDKDASAKIQNLTTEDKK